MRSRSGTSLRSGFLIGRVLPDVVAPARSLKDGDAFGAEIRAETGARPYARIVRGIIH